MFPEFPSQREFGLGITALAIGCDRRSVACPDRVGRGVRRGGRFCRSASRADSRMRDGRGDDPASRSEHPRTRRNRSTGRSVLRDAGCGVRWAALWHPAVAAGSRGGPSCRGLRDPGRYAAGPESLCGTSPSGKRLGVVALDGPDPRALYPAVHV
jgi:hypothetical protein